MLGAGSLYYGLDRGTYINGNYIVINSHNGFTKTKRTLRVGEEFHAEFPDSIDLKITSACGIGCPYCHESSTPGGKSFDLFKTQAVLSTLPQVGIEIAIGGGDIMEIPRETVILIKWLEERGFYTRVTVNWKSLEKYSGDLREACNNYYSKKKYENKNLDVSNLVDNELRYMILHEVGAIGISIDKYQEIESNTTLDTLSFIYTSKPVYHIIAGEFPIEDLRKVWSHNSIYDRVLILGYKDFGRAKGRKPKESLEDWSAELKRLMYETRQYNLEAPTVGFDNLAIEQLSIKDAMTEEEWNSKYFGDEFTCSMYIDAVEEKFGSTSRSPIIERETWVDNGNSVMEYFKKHHPWKE